MAVNLDSLSKKIVKSVLIIGFCITVGLVIYGIFCISEREKMKSRPIIPTKSDLVYSLESKKGGGD